MNRKAYPQEYRMIQILNIMADGIQTGEAADWTAASLANRMNITPSMKLRDLLNHLIIQGAIEVAVEEDAGIAGFKRVYKLPVDHPAYKERAKRRRRKPKKRNIVINGQSSFWEV